MTCPRNSSPTSSAVRRLFSLNCKISLTTRSTCRLPFFGGTNFSTSSVKMISPTRSLFRIAENARIAAISAARSRFSRSPRAEPPGRRHVDDQQHGHLALLAEQLHVRLVHARRDVPVDEPDVVAGDVRAHLLERDAAALEDGVVLARHPIAHQALGDDLDLADPLEQLAGQHDGDVARRGAGAYGTSTRSNSLRTTVSAVMSSASAS